jgi:hypothetical protein
MLQQRTITMGAIKPSARVSATSRELAEPTDPSLPTMMLSAGMVSGMVFALVFGSSDIAFLFVDGPVFSLSWLKHAAKNQNAGDSPQEERFGRVFRQRW